MNLEKMLLNSENEERSQSFARIIFLSIFISYYFANIVFNDKEAPDLIMSVFLSCLVVYTIINFLLILKFPAFNKFRVFVSILFDVTAVSFALYYLEWASLFVYPLYLWIIAGHGMRFGPKFLFIAMGVTLVEYSLIIFNHPFWLQNYHMSYGLMTIIIILPLFFLIMIKRLQNANAELKKQLLLRAEQEAIIIEQSRNAAMGEMINNIAHQWRQPLNAIGLLIQNMQIAYEMGILDDAYMQRSVTKAMSLTNMMSTTIDDFRNFFKPNKEKKLFDCANAIEHTLSIIDANMKNSDISIESELPKGVYFDGYENEFSQVMLNILLNAKDILVEKKNLQTKKIWIRLYEDDTKIVVAVEDNGGGIHKDIIGKVFDPYFTTKADNKGTGIGLYMSKIIIEEHMSGSLSVQNSQEGAEFCIALKKNPKQRSV
jgi:signal transduction histidine kinase